MRVVATAGIIGIGVAIAAIMSSQDSKGWVIGLVVSIVSVVLAAVLWSSRRLWSSGRRLGRTFRYNGCWTWSGSSMILAVPAWVWTIPRLTGVRPSLVSAGAARGAVLRRTAGPC